MPDADKCHLLIPFKEHLTSLANSADADGTVTKADLILAGQREFENYKTLERRINDPACNPSCDCSAAAIRSDELVLSESALAGTFGGFFDTATGVALYQYNTAITDGGYLLTPTYGTVFDVHTAVSITNSGGVWDPSGRIDLIVTITSDVDEVLTRRPVIATAGGKVREEFTFGRPLRCTPGEGFGVGAEIATDVELPTGMNGADLTLVVEFLSIVSHCCDAPVLVL